MRACVRARKSTLTLLINILLKRDAVSMATPGVEPWGHDQEVTFHLSLQPSYRSFTQLTVHFSHCVFLCLRMLV